MNDYLCLHPVMDDYKFRKKYPILIKTAAIQVAIAFVPDERKAMIRRTATTSNTSLHLVSVDEKDAIVSALQYDGVVFLLLPDDTSIVTELYQDWILYPRISLSIINRAWNIIVNRQAPC